MRKDSAWAGGNSANRVIVALGSNLGDSAARIRWAIDSLAQFAIRRLVVSSSLWRTSPVDCPSGSPDFLNAVVAFEPLPAETPESLLPKLQALEQTAGRLRTGVLNEARPLDLDLIAFGGEMRESYVLILPHPRAHLRRFVLAPLAEILPEFRAPGWTGSARELLMALPETGEIARLSE